MRIPENREAVSNLEIDFLGFIFYPPSKRYVGGLPEKSLQDLFSTRKQKVGIFVNETQGLIMELQKRLGLDFIQLHGDETPGSCFKLKETGIRVIKAFRIDDKFNPDCTTPYHGAADFFLFDTKANLQGGTGKKFNWQKLQKYSGDTPFFLSGGIKPGDAWAIRDIEHPFLYGIDLNSGFEDEPGLKNIGLLKQFIQEIHAISG